MCTFSLDQSSVSFLRDQRRKVSTSVVTGASLTFCLAILRKSPLLLGTTLSANRAAVLGPRWRCSAMLDVIWAESHMQPASVGRYCSRSLFCPVLCGRITGGEAPGTSCPKLPKVAQVVVCGLASEPGASCGGLFNTCPRQDGCPRLYARKARLCPALSCAYFLFN